MRKLCHPNIMKLYSVYETDNSIYMILELLKGGNLAELMQDQKSFKIEEIKNIITGISNALVEMEKNGNHLKCYKLLDIIHRDLKPENILFKDIPTDFTNISLADFGFASEATFEKHLFPKCGTPGYVAPEILFNDFYKINCKCDVFSLGIIFHQLLLSCQPFTETNYLQLLKQNAKCQINFFDSKYHKLSFEALDLLQQMLEKNQEERISCQQILVHPFFSTNDEPENFMVESGENYINTKSDNFNKLNEQELFLYNIMLLQRYKMNFKELNSIIFNNEGQNQQDSPSSYKTKDDYQLNLQNNFIVKSTLFSGNLTDYTKLKKINASPECQKNLESDLIQQKNHENYETDTNIKLL